MTHAGWQLIAFDDELTSGITPVAHAFRPLMLVRRGEDVVTYAASCPHRGANLAHGGELIRDAVKCPFHGRRIALAADPGDTCDGQMAVRRFPTLKIGPLILARLDDGPAGDCGFTDSIHDLIGDRQISAAVNRTGTVPVEYVVENAFDVEHFGPVHDVPGVADMQARQHADGRLTIDGDFLTLNDPWIDLKVLMAVQQQLGTTRNISAHMRSGFHAVAFSPTLVFTTFGSSGRDPIIITGALARADGLTHIRVAVAAHEDQPLQHIVTASKLAITQDLQIWNHLDPEEPWHLDHRDAAVLAFRDFTADFPAATRSTAGPGPSSIPAASLTPSAASSGLAELS